VGKQLPALVAQPAQLPAVFHSHVVPATIAIEGEQASWRYIEFFTANIRNPHTRRAYARACGRFFAWCESRHLALTAIRPFDVAAYVERLQGAAAAPSVKQELAAIRMLFDWLVVGQVMPTNPASSVRGPTHVVKTGKTPVLVGGEWRRLIDAIPSDPVRDLRDRALIATLTYSFARITAALKMRVEDLRPRGAGWELRLREKGGKQHVIPCHHALAETLHAYIAAAGIAEERKGWLFRTANVTLAAFLIRAAAMESSSSRASSGVSTGVLPFLMTYLGPRTADAGFTVRTPPVTSQSNSIRIAAKCCLTVGFDSPSLSSFST
jgi:site-specific recombinase XerD